MPPKKAKAAKTAPSAPPDVPAAAGPGIVTEIELRPGEKDSSNLAYIEKLANAWAVIQDHDVFRGIQSEMPLAISGNAAESGNQHPFDAVSYTRALAGASQSYTAGINLFWIDLQWSATPGVPLRTTAIEQMAQTTFRSPCPITDVHIAVFDLGFNPLMHKGALLRVSPEEVTGAVVLAIARDIEHNEDPSVLRAWRRSVLSTTGMFKILPTATDRYWYALQERERIATLNAAVHRSTFQRIHEVNRLMKRLRETTPAAEITAAAIADAYAKNLQMVAGGSGTVTMNFVDCCATISNKMLDTPEIAWCMQDLDERSVLMGIPNPFDSHTRLQAIIDKCRANNRSQLIWVMQGIWYHWRRGNITTLSAADIKGSAQTGNRGLADLMLFKSSLKTAILAKAATLFPESADWWGVTLSNIAESYKSWFTSEESPVKTWRAGRAPSEGKFLSFFSDVVFGKVYDGPIKLAIKSSKTAAEALQMPGVVEFLQEIEAKRALEKGPVDAKTEDCDASLDPEVNLVDDDIVFHLPAKDSSKQPTTVKASAVHEGPKREMLESIIANTRQHIEAQIQLVVQEPDEPHPHGLHAEIMATPVGKLRGSPSPADPASSKYIGVFYDPKLSGEANHRPQLRVPPLRYEPFKRLIELARGRFGPEVGDDIPDGDLYFLFDGGKMGNQVELLKPFSGKPKSVKTFILWRDEDSLVQRQFRVRGGIGTYRQEERLHIISANIPALKPVKFQNFKGSSGGSMMGPIILPPVDSMWSLLWPKKKDLFTAANLIPVGGRAGPDEEHAEDEIPKVKPRDKDTTEPVFFHALPGSFYDELLSAIPLAGVLDLCPGDGALALAAFKRGICYTGLCFSEPHKKLLSQHLERSIWQGMSDDTDLLYEPRLVAALVDDTESSQVKPAGKSKGKAKAKAKGNTDNKRPRPPGEEPDPIENEPDHDGDEDMLSGDEPH